MKGTAIALGAFFGLIVGLPVGYFLVPKIMPTPEPAPQVEEPSQAN